MVRKALVSGAVFLGLMFTSSCSGETVITPRSTLTIAPPQNPYTSGTKTPIPPTATIVIPTEEPLLPTPTPFKHIVQPGDTLYGLALKYNISLDNIVSANPGLDTSLLSVGTELIIPYNADEDLAVPTPTPYPIAISDPYCYPTRSGGTWCIVIANNDQDITLENITAAINIYNSRQELINSFIAISPINNLLPGKSLPLTTYIDEQLPESFQANAVLLTSLPSEGYEPRTEISEQSIDYGDKGKTAVITGSIIAYGEELKDSQIWIAAVAYNEGSPIGVRKWISSQDLIGGEEIPFELILYSLGPPIDDVKLFSELH